MGLNPYTIYPLDGHFSCTFVVKIVFFLFQGTKINEKEARDGPFLNKNWPYWEVVVAQLVEQLLPIPEVRGSNPVIGKIY